jgi:hypothetical protein
MIANDLVKEAIVTNLRAYAALTAQLPDGVQGVREQHWRGTVFQYPNVRVELESQIDVTPNNNCTPAYQTWSVYVFSEKQSSQEADTLAGLIVSHFKGITFTVNTVKFSNVSILESIPATPEDEHTWRAQVRCQSVINTAS